MTRLTRRALALGLAALPLPALAQKTAAAPLSQADRALVDRAATYLQGLTEAKGRFVQTDARGASGSRSNMLETFRVEAPEPGLA